MSRKFLNIHLARRDDNSLTIRHLLDLNDHIKFNQTDSFRPRSMNQVTKITVNGRQYDNVEQMPPDVREIYLRAVATMRDAEPEGAPGVIKKNIVSRVIKESITCNGRSYESREELPPEARKLLENMPAVSGDIQKSEVIIKTINTFAPKKPNVTSWVRDAENQERDPKIAWLLVMMLSVVVLILLFLLYLSSLRHKGG